MSHTAATNHTPEAFLSQVANDLLHRYGNDLSHITVVFPNRRARLFFNEYLCQASDKPVWAPAYASLEELFHQASNLHIADPLKLLTALYYSYISVYNRNKQTPAIETFDEFYFFGEILLSDFQDVDKNLVNEQALFSNLSDLDQLKDDFEHLDTDQWETIQRFFKDISINSTQLKEAFFSIWNMLGTVYSEFKKKLVSEGIAYDGMLFRSVIEAMQEKGVAAFPQEKYAFVGFNVLTKCEQQLFKILKQNDKALFFWDFDDYYMTEAQEAGRFMRENIAQFGNDLKEMDTNILATQAKKITLMASPSENAQAGYIPQWIDELNYTQGFETPDTAIVLCNEQNLQAVMHAIPPSAEHVNITMGYPLSQTPVYSLLTMLAELQLKGADKQQRFRYNYVLPVLRHPYIRLAFAEAHEVQKKLVKEHNFFPTQADLENKQVFTTTNTAAELASYLVDILKTVAEAYGKTEQENSFSELYSEALFRAFQVVNRLKDLLTTGELEVEPATLVSLLKRMLSGTSIPFHGEPARGLQIMGVLETRNMDFRNILMMSTNEGVLPKTDNDSSFIPHFIRKFFGMTTIEHQDSLYAYYFYRLLQRAEHIVLMYNTANQLTGKSEMSRFLLQLLTEYPHAIEQINLQSEIKPHHPIPLTVEKTDLLLQQIKNKYDFLSNPEAKSLSPSAFNNYLDCSLRFYLQYIENIKPTQELDDVLDSSVLGRVFHRTVELIYRQIGRLGKDEENFPSFIVKEDHIDGFIAIKGRIDKIIEEAFNDEFFMRTMPRDRYNGEQLIYFRIVQRFVKRQLQMDKALSPFSIVGLEQNKYRYLHVNDMQLQVGGKIDRLDSKDGVLHVVDYKTGGEPKAVKEMQHLFKSAEKRANYVFQAFVYASILSKEQSERVVPQLVYINKATDEAYSPTINWDKVPIADFRELEEDFEAAFIAKIEELFDPTIPFKQTENKKTCEWCDFKNMCGR